VAEYKDRPTLTFAAVRPTRLILIVSLALTLMAFSVACGEQEQKEFRIGLVAPITGSIPEVGQSSVDAANMVVDEINEAGGLVVGGEAYEVVLLIEDNEDKAEVSVRKVLALINQQGVVAIVGPQASRNAIPAAAVAEKSKVPMISPWSSNPETTRNKRWVFRAAFMDPFQGRALAAFSRQQLKAKTVAVLFDVASEYNKGLAEFFKASFEEMGGVVVSYESYTTDAPDISRQLARIKSSGAEVLFLPNYYNEVPGQALQARDVGIDAQILGSDTWTGILEADRDQVDGAYFSSQYDSTAADPLAQEFAARYRAAFGRDPDDVAALTADALGLLFEAARSQRLVDPEAIRNGMANTKSYQGITGTFKYDGVTGDPIKSIVLLGISNGEFVFHSRIDP
jgi:branched-chain amino acid transport system substrate-binding protein